MSYPASYKTVFVIDHSPFFAESCNQPIEYDLISKTRTQGLIPLASLSKSLWTCSVEAIVEYCRVVYDVYPNGKHISLIASDSEARPVTSWNLDEQNVQPILSSLANLGPPNRDSDSSDCSIIHGLAAAVEQLSEPTEGQQQMRNALTEDSDDKMQNTGRIVCITCIKSTSHAEMLKECVRDSIIQQNKVTTGSDSLLPIDLCDCVLINTFPVDADAHVKDQKPHSVNPNLMCQVHSVRGGRYLANKMNRLLLDHYDLAITVITGIPMKEEQNASSSANYDVDLLHDKSAHVEIHKLEAVQQMSSATEAGASGSGSSAGTAVPPSTRADGNQSVLLKWCQPRASSGEFLYCTGTYRVSPGDVNSRPSLCLTNFLLNGRQVMLEQPRKLGAKVTSHMLASHGGEIFLHSLSTVRSQLEDPPSISEGCGGRVTDYRITDFGEFMKENRLAPCQETPEMEEEQAIERSKSQLERMTRHWPMVISDTIIFNMPSHLDPLQSLITKPVLDDDEVLECKKVIYHLVGMESRNESLPVPSIGFRGKAPKKDEQYRQMWSEMEILVRAASSTSPAHQQVLECLLDCRKPALDDPGRGSAKRAAEKVVVKAEPELIPQDLSIRSTVDRSPTLAKVGVEFTRASRNGTEQPPIKKQRVSVTEAINKHGRGPQSLLSLWSNRVTTLHSKKHVEFAGRAESGGSCIAQLYPNLNQEQNENGNNDNGKGVNGKGMNGKGVKKERT